jgi:hypothetical protein
VNVHHQPQVVHGKQAPVKFIGILTVLIMCGFDRSPRFSLLLSILHVDDKVAIAATLANPDKQHARAAAKMVLVARNAAILAIASSLSML